MSLTTKIVLGISLTVIGVFLVKKNIESDKNKHEIEVQNKTSFDFYSTLLPILTIF